MQSFKQQLRSLKQHQHRALIKRAKANREKLGPQPGPGRPGLSPWQRCSPTVHVTGLDLVDFPRDLRSSHRRELLRRREPRRTRPADVLVLELLALFNGLRPGGGTKLQLPLELEQDVTGYGESTLQAAHQRLVDREFIFRDEEMRELEWVDREGGRHFLCQVWSKMRITAAGLEHLRALGETKRVIIPVGAQRARVTVVGGLAWALLKTCDRLLRMLARRFASAYEKKTPPLRGETLREEKPVDGARLGAPDFSTEATGPPSRSSETSPPTAGVGGERGGGSFPDYHRAELKRLKSLDVQTVMQGYPALYWRADRMGRRQLERDFERFYRRELHEWFQRTSTRQQQLIQIARVEADVDQLELWEANEPSEAEKRFQYHNYGRLWRPWANGPARPGGRYVKGNVSAIEELKKQQAADRADGVLAPKKKRRPRA